MRFKSCFQASPILIVPLASFYFRDEPIPDPVKLLRRLAALESRIDQLRKDCVEVAESKQEMALAVSDIQLKNAHMLRKVRLLCIVVLII